MLSTWIYFLFVKLIVITNDSPVKYDYNRETEKKKYKLRLINEWHLYLKTEALKPTTYII